MILPNGHIIRRGAPLPMPVVPRDRVEPRSARCPRPLAVRLYDRAIGPQPRVTLPYAVEALLKIETPAPQAVIVDEPPPGGKIVNVRNIIAVVRRVCDVEHADIIGPWRHKQATRARHIVMWLAKRHTMTSLPQIGRWIGRRDHTTVLHGIRKIDALIKRDTAEAETVRAMIVQCRIALGLPIYDQEENAL